MTIDELVSEVQAGENIKYGNVKDLLEGHAVANKIGSDIPINFDNCNLTVNGAVTESGHLIQDSAILYNPVL